MAKKTRTDGLTLAIIIINLLIVGVIITLCALIYLYMTGKLEDTNVADLGQETEPVAIITTTPITEPEPEPEEETSAPEKDPDELIVEGDEAVTGGSSADEEEPEEETFATTAEGEQPEEDAWKYSEEFFANDMFIGDSIYTGLVNYGYFPASQVFAQIGLNPESARTKAYNGQTAVTAAQAMQPKRIFIMLGTNGLAYMSNTHMTEQLKLLTQELREVCPDSYVYIVSIPPVTKEHDSQGQETMLMVNSYNKLLKEMAEEAGVVYLDLCSKLKDASGYFSADYAEADGLHFLGSAYVEMLTFFQNSIQG